MNGDLDPAIEPRIERKIPWGLVAVLAVIGVVAAVKAVLGPPRSELPLPPFESIRFRSTTEEIEGLSGPPDKVSESTEQGRPTIVWSYYSSRRRGEPAFIRLQTCSFIDGRLFEKTQLTMPSKGLFSSFERTSFDALETGSDAETVLRILGAPTIVQESAAPAVPGTSWTYLRIGASRSTAVLRFNQGRLESKEWQDGEQDAPDTRDE
jgi:hypothetical protein